MTIGLDIDKDTNNAEGYLQLTFDGRKKFNRSEYYNVFATYPEYIREEIRNNGTKINDNERIVDTYVSFNDLVETYQANKESFDSFAETHKFINFEDPTFFDLLKLASDINSYCGLD